jgi:hypothetical protein
VTWNDEQIELCALMVTQLEVAWRAQYSNGPQIAATAATTATLNNSQPDYKLPNDLGLPRIGAIDGGGCGKSKVLLEIINPLCEIFFEKWCARRHLTELPGASMPRLCTPSLG